MSVVDQQLKHNDCGISAIKTIYNVLGKDVHRDYIQENIFLNERGSRLTDIKDFFVEHGFDANYKLIDVNSIDKNTAFFQDLFPFILPVKRKTGLHYLVVNGLKKNKLKILDPSKARTYYFSLQELKQGAYFASSLLDLISTDEKIDHLISTELKEYSISKEEALTRNDRPQLFNKLTYFSHHVENFGFKDKAAEGAFLNDLVFNQEISFLPKSFRSLKYKNDKMRIKAPIILSVKPTAKATGGVSAHTDETNVFKRLVKELGSNKKLWNIYIFASLFAASITQFAVFINQILIDNVLPSFQVNILVLFAIGVGLFKLFELIVSQYKRFVSIHLGNILDKYFISVFDKKINDFSIQYIQSYRRGDLTERLSDSLKLKSFFLKFFTRILVDVIISVYSLVLLFFIEWRLTIVVLIVMLIYFAWFKIITPYLKTYERLRFQKKADLFSKMIEKIDGIQVIKNFKIENVMSNTILDGVDSLIKTQTKLRYINLLNTSVVSVVTTSASLFILVFLAQDAIENQTISIGQILTFLMLSGRVFSALSGILKQNLTLQEHEVILKRYFDFNDDELEAKPTVDNGIADFSIEKLKLNGISFGYFPDQPIIKDIGFTINKGQKIQIEGRNGSGKSTLSKVIALLYKPQNGSFEINETESAFYNQEKTREKVLLVSNEDILFNETIEFNIALGKKVENKTIINLAKGIGLYDFIAGKEEKLEFVINEGGKNLSTGQRKKVLLMRALLSSAEIVILDEVLSGIDKESRKDIESLINNFDKTFIVISHEPIEEIQFDAKYRITHGELTAI